MKTIETKDHISNDEFDEILNELVGKMTASQILSYGDVYTILSEELNNAVIEVWESRRPCPETIREIEEEGPQEGDITTEDHRIWYQYGKTYFCGDEAGVRAKMEADKFWPNLWFISDHGNAHLIVKR